LVTARNHRTSYRKKLENLQGKVFQFNDILSDTENRQTYMYVDLTVSFLNSLRKNDQQMFIESGFKCPNPDIMESRAKEQDCYIANSSGLFTMGHWLQDWLIHKGIPSDCVHFAGGGTNVDVSLINPLPKTHNKILFIGMDFRRKGGFITYEAFKLLRESGENVELYVIGPSSNPIKSPENGYHYIGQISFDEEAKYLNMCDIFCMPSYFEAYGLVFVEALTFGLPCIGRNRQEMPYFIKDGETGLLLKNDDPNELAHLMLRALHEKSFSENVLARREQYINDYSWDTVAKRIASIIR
jgi:glycosyltransferase involved in cell wall biosynthesis